MNPKKLETIKEDCYIELYKNATPSASFRNLVRKAKKNALGKKVIDYNSYSISRDDYLTIIRKYEKRLPSYWRKSFRSQMYLGCGPKII